ncbi:MAG: DUF1573 domain-containing protein [Planctomycetota bacterium]|nr:DUF1573 domain-containing protein [Planctomycetota bacterium]MDG2143662.1 DUF1573 domain-containing protein [Planctomycetota bacterium]
MLRNIKTFSLLGLALVATASLAISLQEGKSETKGEKSEAKSEEATKDTGRPKRLGKTLGGGIKIKPRPTSGATTGTTTPVVNGPQPLGGTPSRAPVGKGGIGFDAGSQMKNFGSMVQGEVEHHTFAGESNGEEPLIISSLNKSCGCTRAQMMLLGEEGKKTPYQMGKPIAVGTKFIIESTFDTANKVGPTQSNITLVSNDPRGSTVFTLQGNVTPAMTLAPASLNFAMMKSADVRKGQVIVTSEAYGKFKLSLDPNIPLKEMRVKLTPDSPDADGKSTRWVVNVEGGPNLPEGNLSRAIRLVSDIEQAGKFLPDGSPQFYDRVLFVTGQVLGPVKLTPPHVSFGLVRPGQVATRSAVLSVNAEGFSLDTAPKTSFKGFGVDFPYAGDFEVNWTQDETTGNWNLDLTLLGLEQEGNGSFRGLVEIEVGHEARKTIELGFSGVVRGGVTGAGGK